MIVIVVSKKVPTYFSHFYNLQVVQFTYPIAEKVARPEVSFKKRHNGNPKMHTLLYFLVPPTHSPQKHEVYI